MQGEPCAPCRRCASKASQQRSSGRRAPESHEGARTAETKSCPSRRFSMAFKRKKQPPIRSLIGEGTVVQGELRFDAGLRVDGEIQGDVVATDPSSLLVISENARIMGKVMAGHVIINGQVHGPVVSTALLELQPK